MVENLTAFLDAFVRLPTGMDASVRVLAVFVKIRQVLHGEGAQQQPLGGKRLDLLDSLSLEVFLPCDGAVDVVGNGSVGTLIGSTHENFLGKSELLQHASAGRIGRKITCADQQQTQLLKAVPQQFLP